MPPLGPSLQSSTFGTPMLACAPLQSFAPVTACCACCAEEQGRSKESTYADFLKTEQARADSANICRSLRIIDESYCGRGMLL